MLTVLPRGSCRQKHVQLLFLLREVNIDANSIRPFLAETIIVVYELTWFALQTLFTTLASRARCSRRAALAPRSRRTWFAWFATWSLWSYRSNWPRWSRLAVFSARTCSLSTRVFTMQNYDDVLKFYVF